MMKLKISSKYAWLFSNPLPKNRLSCRRDLIQSTLCYLVNQSLHSKIVFSVLKFIVWFVMFFLLFNMGCMVTLKNYKSEIESKWPPSKSLNVSHYVQLDKLTASVLPSKPCAESTFVLIVVESARKNFEKREAIRDTYGLWIQDQAGKYWNGLREDFMTPQNPGHSKMKFRLIFLLGKNPDELEDQIRLESKVYDDIVVENFEDNYYNLTLKSVFALKYGQDYCPGARFIMKIDDDVFLHIPNLERFLLEYPLNERRIIGQLIPKFMKITNPYNKNFMPDYVYSKKYLPSFMLGPSYIISSKLVKEILYATSIVPYYLGEDVYITGFLANKVGAFKTDIPEYAIDRRVHVDHCLFQRFITAYTLSPTEMRNLWKELILEKSLKRCRRVTGEELWSLTQQFTIVHSFLNGLVPEWMFNIIHYFASFFI